MSAPEQDGLKDRPIRTFGRTGGRPLSPRQQQLIETRLDHWRLLQPAAPDFQPLSVFPSARAVWLEIGFGGGEHMVHMAAAYPDIGLIGCEPFINGVAMLLGRIRSAGVTNLAIHPGDVRDLFDVLPPASIARAFLNYPDPWPKRRHHRRRFVTRDHLVPLARALRPGAEFRIASDIPDYIRQARLEVPRAGFRPVRDGPTPWDDWRSTRYEIKALREGRLPHYLTFLRN